MSVHIHPRQTRSCAHHVLVGRLLHLAEDTERAGLRPEALLLTGMAYSVLDQTAGPDCAIDPPCAL